MNASDGDFQSFPVINGGLEARYKKTLAVILTTNAQLKDDTYLQHLLTETFTRLTTFSQLRDCGIIGFIETVLEKPSSESALVTLALQFFEKVVKVSNVTKVSDTVTDSLAHHGPREEPGNSAVGDLIKNILHKYLNSLMQSNDSNVLS